MDARHLKVLLAASIILGLMLDNMFEEGNNSLKHRI